MKNLKRAARKRLQRTFKVGDWVTWGYGTCWHQVVKVTVRGVVVDVTGEKDVEYWASPQHDGRFFLLVLYDHNMQGNSTWCRFREVGVNRGPPVKVDPEEENKKKMLYRLQYGKDGLGH